jgi:hypothetical protein
MKRSEILSRWPHASEDLIKANLDYEDPRQTTFLESYPSFRTMGKVQAKKGTSRKFLVRVTSIRKRLLDIDNLCEKYHVDLCRYAGIISSDAPGTTEIEVCQRKTQKGEEEFVEIEVFSIPQSS